MKIYEHILIGCGRWAIDNEFVCQGWLKKDYVDDENQDKEKAQILFQAGAPF